MSERSTSSTEFYVPVLLKDPSSLVAVYIYMNVEPQAPRLEGCAASDPRNSTLVVLRWHYLCPPLSITSLRRFSMTLSLRILRYYPRSPSPWFNAKDALPVTTANLARAKSGPRAPENSR